MDNEISAVMTATMSKIKEMVDTNTVVGEPITTPDDITLIPLSRVSFAFASGGSEFPMKENKNGVGCGSGAANGLSDRQGRQCAHAQRHAAGIEHV
jgi:uncharacterized spore protein YtfJ